MMTIEEHAENEEAIAAMYFPKWARRWLIGQHKRLRARGFPKREVRAHARAEIRLFEKFAPWTVERIRGEHRELENGSQG